MMVRTVVHLISSKSESLISEILIVRSRYLVQWTGVDFQERCLEVRCLFYSLLLKRRFLYRIVQDKNVFRISRDVDIRECHSGESDSLLMSLDSIEIIAITFLLNIFTSGFWLQLVNYIILVGIVCETERSLFFDCYFAKFVVTNCYHGLRLPVITPTL